MPENGEPLNNARVKFAELLAAHSWLVHRCPEEKCRRSFVANRLNQQYCSKRCQMRAAMRAYRERLQAAREGKSKHRQGKMRTAVNRRSQRRKA